METHIAIKGVKTHNLKNIDLFIPRGKITALVGVSGAGKTSLAFDTIHAEGYIRYIESISPYVRQFLDKIEKPPVESIDGLPPAIAFRQKKPAKNPRSIVATSMDLYDYLKILYAKIADFHCPGCGEQVKAYSIDEIIAELLDTAQDEKIHVCFSYKGDVAFLINRGYYFHIENNKKARIDHTVKDKEINVLIDSVKITPDNKSRLFEALDASVGFGSGQALVYFTGDPHNNKQEGKQDGKHIYPAELYCMSCDARYPEPDEHLFSFNSPKGACPDCNGFGDVQVPDPALIFDPERSLAGGAAKPLSTPAFRRFQAALLKFAYKYGIDTSTPVKNLSAEHIDMLVNGHGRSSGLGGFFRWLKRKQYKVQARVLYSRYVSYRPCVTCEGSRLNPLARAFKIDGVSISDFLSFSIERALEFTRPIHENAGDYRGKLSPRVIEDIYNRLDFLVESGIPYIQLDRSTFTLSRGELQRINLAFVLGSTLSDSLIIMEQPSSDLHPSDYARLNSFFHRLKENGNTVLIVEHNPDIVRFCDHVVELGPMSGENGGEIMFSGGTREFFAPSNGSPTVTQDFFLRAQSPVKSAPQRAFKKYYRVRGASAHNLKNIDVDIPQNAFTVITGVSGAGKTTLLHDELYKQIPGARFIDPVISGTRTASNVAGFFDVFKSLREMYAKLKESRINRYTPGHFSFNSPRGRCEHCGGKGFNEIEMQFLPAVDLVCGQCNGTGYRPDVLKIRFKEKNIHQLLEMSIERLIELVKGDIPAGPLKILENIRGSGLGYLKAGQRLNTLSTGELQRMKLVNSLDMGKTKTGTKTETKTETKTSGVLFLIDEPTFGMHHYDVEMVKNLIDRLVAAGNTVVAAEHHAGLIAHAGYIVELGPVGGEKGGYLIRQEPV